jgi:hypothetical protein
LIAPCVIACSAILSVCRGCVVLGCRAKVAACCTSEEIGYETRSTRPARDRLHRMEGVAPHLPESGVLLVAYVIGLDPRSTVQLSYSPIPPRLHSHHTNIMADNDIATRAPESDAQENPADPAVAQSVFPGDTRAQEGPSMGVSRAECCQ